MRVAFLEGAHASAWENFMEDVEEFENSAQELLVALGNNVRDCFRWFFKLYQNSL